VVQCSAYGSMSVTTTNMRCLPLHSTGSTEDEEPFVHSFYLDICQSAELRRSLLSLSQARDSTPLVLDIQLLCFGIWASGLPRDVLPSVAAISGQAISQQGLAQSLSVEVGFRPVETLRQTLAVYSYPQS
jgi:hypothetical protein